jgi:hypothetical protein
MRRGKALTLRGEKDKDKSSFLYPSLRGDREKERERGVERVRERERDWGGKPHNVGTEVAMIFQKRMSRNNEETESLSEVITT